MISYIGRCLLCTALSMGIAGTIHAQSTDADFIAYLSEVCDDEDISPELFFLCMSLFPPANPVPGAPPPPPPVTGAGIQAAQGRNANGVATQQRAAVFERIDEIKTETDASTDSRLAFGKWGWFGSLSTGASKRDPSQFERGYTSDISGFISGIDYRFSDRLVSGIALAYLSSDTKFNGNIGRLNSDSQTLTLFTTTNPDTNSYLDGYLGWAWQDLNIKRNLKIGFINDQATGNTDARQTIAGFASGYQWYKDRWNISADAKMDYIDTDIEAYSDNALSGSGSGFAQAFSRQKTRSLTGAFGTRIGYTKNLNIGALNPFVRAFYVREFEDDGREVSSQLQLAPDRIFVEMSDKPDRDYFILGTGTTLVLPHGLQFFINLEVVSGHQYISKWNLSNGFRLEF